MVARLLNKTCIVKGTTKTLGQYNRPILTEGIKGTYPCRLSRQNLQTTALEPQTQLNYFYRLYTVPEADIVAGDTVEVDGVEYKAGIPYKPRHTEVDLIKVGDA